jgi:STE24 endopeptidase
MFYPDDLSPWIVPVLSTLILARWTTEQLLAHLNERHVRAHAQSIPERFRDLMEPATYDKAVRYTLARSRFNRVQDSFDAALLLVLLLTGALPWLYHHLAGIAPTSTWATASAIILILLALSCLSWPFAWAAQFQLEQRFGFNTTTQRTWWTDRLKSLLLTVLLAFPLLVLILKMVDGAGPLWWVWAWLILLAFQLAIVLLAPVLIFPLFNRFDPLPEGSLRQRLCDLADRTSFRNRSIMVMDGSRRSLHLNAFFTGFGRFRRIVLFDTLMSQLDDHELEAVLAHEIGHYKLGHVPRRLIVSAASSLAGFWIIAQLAQAPAFTRALGFQEPGIGPTLLLILVFGGVFSFWLSPFLNFWSRRHEFQADRFAANAVGSHAPLLRALRKLTRHNLSNLTPHPLYSAFHYSHPALLERELALQQTQATHTHA